VDELDRLGLLRECGGAACVFPTASPAWTDSRV